MNLTLKQLSEQSGIPERTIRFYIQKGLLPRPMGDRRGAFYTQDHLGELLRIRQWQEVGLSLDAIGDLLLAKRESPVSPSRPGSIEVRSHLIIADGLELMVAADRTSLTQAQIRQLFQAIQSTYNDLTNNNISDQ